MRACRRSHFFQLCQFAFARDLTVNLRRNNVVARLQLHKNRACACVYVLRTCAHNNNEKKSGVFFFVHGRRTTMSTRFKIFLSRCTHAHTNTHIHTQKVRKHTDIRRSENQQRVASARQLQSEPDSLCRPSRPTADWRFFAPSITCRPQSTLIRQSIQPSGVRTIKTLRKKL